jgi:hypothetical protein
MHQGLLLRLVAKGLRKPLQTLSTNHIPNKYVSHQTKFAPMIELDFKRIDDHDLEVSRCETFLLYFDIFVSSFTLWLK